MRIDRGTFEEILQALSRNKSRSLLTAFGIFWGIFMLVALMGGGKGMQGMMQSNFKGFAAHAGFLVSSPTGEPYKGFRRDRNWSITLEDLRLLQQNISGIEVLTASVARWDQTAVCNDRRTEVIVKGQFPEYSQIEFPEIMYGRYLNEIDIRQERKVCFIGKRVYETLFEAGTNPCGQYMAVNGVYYQIVGVSSTSEGQINIQGPMPSSVLIPFTTMQTTYQLGEETGVICYTVQPGYRVKDINQQMETILRRRHDIAPNDKQAFNSFDTEAIFLMMDNLFLGIRLLMWMVGLGTLLAGAIGVSNIMMVVVKERTSEIGIRRAIGAHPRYILTQILVESLCLTAVSGMCGICFGVAVLQVVKWGVAQGENAAVSFQVSFGFAIGVSLLLVALGILSGLAPAYRAMAVKPIEAMREE